MVTCPSVRTFFIYQPDENVGPGAISGALADAGCKHVVKPMLSRRYFDPYEYSGLIVLGGGDVHADSKHYATQRECLCIAIHHPKPFPVLGICLGAQLLAVVLGGSVGKSTKKRLHKGGSGWRSVFLNEEGKNDPVMSRSLCGKDCEDGIPMYQSHADTCRPPAYHPNVVKLAYSSKLNDDGRHLEAFRFGKKVYGIQFHPEVTDQILREWHCREKKEASLRMGRKLLDAWIELAVAVD